MKRKYPTEPNIENLQSASTTMWPKFPPTKFLWRVCCFLSFLFRYFAMKIKINIRIRNVNTKKNNTRCTTSPRPTVGSLNEFCFMCDDCKYKCDYSKRTIIRDIHDVCGSYWMLNLQNVEKCHACHFSIWFSLFLMYVFVCLLSVCILCFSSLNFHRDFSTTIRSIDAPNTHCTASD